MASPFSDTVSSPLREEGKTTFTAELQKYYSIFLWDLERQEVPTDARLDPSGTRPTAEFFFTMPPQSIELAEPFTTKVISTQNGGKYVESHGSIYKMLSISGTTGLRPNKGAPNEIPLLNTSNFENLIDPGALRPRIDPKEVTGLDNVHFLRNIFRRYSDFKHVGRKVIMIWRNAKDDDYWVVEPENFKLVKGKESPLTYKYAIQLKGISPFEATLTLPADPLNIFDEVSSRSARVQGYLQALNDSFLVIATNINRIKAAGYFAVDLVTGPLISVLSGLAAVNNANRSVVKGFKQAIVEADSRLKEAVEALEASLEPVGATGATVDRRSPILRALRRSIITLSRLRAERFVQNSTGAVASQAGNNVIGTFINPSASRSGITARQELPNRVREATLNRGETIGNVAKRLLGTSARWHEIAILNSLSAPYTSDSPTLVPGVLAPGDRFLYPSSEDGTDPFAIAPINPAGSQDSFTSALSRSGEIATQAFGRDIRLETSSDIDLSNFGISQSGDLDTVVGTANVEQALKIKFITEQGTLLMHPQFGALFAIGSKADAASFNTFRVNVVATMKSDPRISEVEYAKFLVVGDVLLLEARVKLNQTNDYVNTTFALRRF